jgi:hypothetical protein
MNAIVTRIEKPIGYPEREISTTVGWKEYQQWKGQQIPLATLEWTNTEDIMDYDPNEKVRVDLFSQL